jgi:ABC-type branched-subunit amino acid transport system substrate-binding protein
VKIKKLGALAATVALVPVLAACGGSGSSGGSGGGSGGEPLKVALIPPSSGALAMFGEETTRAWQLAADEVNAKGGIDGHKVELVVLETNGTPAQTVRAARKAVTQDGVAFVSGIATSPENIALAPQLASLGVVNVVSMSKDDTLTGSACSPNMYRTTVSSGMDVKATASVLGDLPAKKWAILMTDSLTGRNAAKAFEKEAEKAGKEVVSVQYNPIGTTDYGSYISKMKQSGADGLYTYESAADGVAFVNQADQFSLFDQIETFLGFSTISEPTFEPMGDTILGFHNNLNYSWRFDNPQNAAFVAEYERRFKSKPYFITAENHIAAQFLFEAVRKAGSTEVARVKAAMDAMSLDTVVGKLQMRAADHQAVRDTFVGKVVKDGDGLGWDVVSTVPPSVSTPQADGACKL